MTQPKYLNKSGQRYLPRDYRVVPWEHRSLALRVYELQMQQPFEEVLSLMWYKYRRLRPISNTLGMESTTLRRWMKALGLFICSGCSHTTGLLHTETIHCTGCNRYFCTQCTENKPDAHFRYSKTHPDFELPDGTSIPDNRGLT